MPPKQQKEVPTPEEWQKEASAILRSLIARDSLRPEQVVNVLQLRGIIESDRGLKEKMLNGTFSFSWFLQFIVAIERHPFLLEPELTLPSPDESFQKFAQEQIEKQIARNSARAKKGIRSRKPLKASKDEGAGK